MTKQEAITGLVNIIQRINEEKINYDAKYMFNSSLFFRKYMSEHIVPLTDNIRDYLSYITDEEILKLEVPNIWTEEKSIDFINWMMFFDQWTKISR